MTEDDTFNTLRRTPIDKLVKTIRQIYDGSSWGQGLRDGTAQKFVEGHGWDWYEYCRAYDNEFGDEDND